MIVKSNHIQRRRLLMIESSFQDLSSSYFGRKILQANSPPASFDASQPSFIALICVIAMLTIIFVVIIVILYRRFQSERERKLMDSYDYSNIFQRIFNIERHPSSVVAVSTTATSSSYSAKAFEHSSSHHQTLSSHTLPARRTQQTTIDAYLNDLNLFPSNTIDVKQLNSYLFIDLHSTSSETLPDQGFKQFTNKRFTRDDSQREDRSYSKEQQRRLTRSYGSRFLMRQRYSSNNSHKLPQLRQTIMQQQKHLFGIDDSYNSSTTIMSQTLQSLKIFPTNNDYQNRILQTIKEEGPSVSFHPLHYEEEPYLFEMISTSYEDDTAGQIPYRSDPMNTNRIAYINDSIIV